MKKIFSFVFIFFMVNIFLYTILSQSAKHYGDVKVIRNKKEYSITDIKPTVGDTIITSDDSVCEIILDKKNYYIGRSTKARITDKSNMVLDSGFLYKAKNKFKSIEDFLSLDKSIKIYADPYPFYSGKLGMLFIQSSEELSFLDTIILEKNYPIIKFYPVENRDADVYVYRTSFGAHISWQLKTLPFKANIDIGKKVNLTLSIPLKADYTPPPPKPSKPKQMTGVNSAMTNILSDAQKSANERNMLQRDVYTKFLSTNFARGIYTIPTQGRISSLYGAFRGYTSSYASYHQGHDIANTNGTPIYAANDGIVRISRDLFVRGKCVVIDHGEGVFSTYFHMSKRVADENTFVKKGELIGHIGSTGLSTGPHLHWEMRAGNITFDPLTILERSFIFDKNLYNEIR